jgi:hypothetical protein
MSESADPPTYTAPRVHDAGEAVWPGPCLDELPTLDALVDQLDEARALLAGVADALPELRHRAASDDVRELLDTLAVHVGSAWASVVLAHNIARPAAPVTPA